MKTILALFILIFSCSSFAGQSIELIYSNTQFKIPAGFSVIADAFGTDNILVFRYGDVKSKRYLTFTDMTSDSSVEYGCGVATFYTVLFSARKDKTCNKENLMILSDVFVKDRDIEVWSYGSYQISYSSGKKDSVVFLAGPDEKLVKIDTDFLEKEQVKSMFSGLMRN